jgi:3-phenylpropionate/cinnamic acid dioxygenase small subunit
MSNHPSFAAELGYAVAREWLTLTLADVAILARYSNIDEAARHAREMRESAAIWRHTRDQLRLRIRELTTTNARARLPWNAIMAQAHDINQSQTLDEPEVTAIVTETIYDTLPDARRRGHGP